MAPILVLLAFVLFCEGTKTVFTFSRKINTCDPEDRELQNATSKIIWSYNDNDPKDPNTILYHQNRGVTSVRFLNPETTEPDLPADAQSLDIQEKNSTIVFTNSPHGPTTQYWCTAHKINMTGRQHVVRVEPLVDPKYTKMIHHMLLYICPFALDEQSLSYEGGCFDANMPGAVYQCNGGKMLTAWAVGGSPFDYPVDVGFPLGPGAVYFVMEIHIENPTLVPMKDSSGFRFYTTPTLRQYDAGVAVVGVDVNPSLVIPPQQADYQFDGYCPSACTQQMFGPNGIKILAGGLHTHIAGRRMYWHHYRSNQELRPIIEEPYYDFNYQDFSIFDPPIDVLPGDEMRVECHYNTIGRNSPTNMGLSTQEEMCMAFYVYYPAGLYEDCSYGNYTFLGGQSQARCAGVTIPDAALQPYTAYVAPPCTYDGPDPERTIPTLKTTGVNPADYERNQFLDEDGKYKLYWTVNKTSLTINAAVEVETTGWVGLGISPNGMEGADVLIGWVKDGLVYFADRFATEKAQPSVDVYQDYYDITGAEVASAKPEASQTWVEGLSRPVIAVFFTGVGAVIVLIGACIYARYRKKQAQSEYHGLDEEHGTKESVLLDG